MIVTLWIVWGAEETMSKQVFPRRGGFAILFVLRGEDDDEVLQGRRVLETGGIGALDGSWWAGAVNR